MKCISFIANGIGQVRAQALDAVGPTDMLLIMFVFPFEIGETDAIKSVPNILSAADVYWLGHGSGKEDQWRLDLDGLASDFPTYLASLTWLRGRIPLVPQFERDEIYSRVKFIVELSSLFSLAGGTTTVVGAATPRRRTGSRLEEVCSRSPRYLVPATQDSVSPEAQTELAENLRRAQAPGPMGIKARYGNHTIRSIWNRLYFRPATETFHQFIVLVLSLTMGKSWFRAQSSEPPQGEHPLKTWFAGLENLCKESMPEGTRKGGAYVTARTGEVQELITLADDVYRLQLVRRLPTKLRKRLQDATAFRGARYEVAIAASFVRAGFEIEWIDEKNKKHCEFNARHKGSGEVIAVETKSRHRTHPPNLNADIVGLFRQALLQGPGDRPFAIFVDVNLPSHTNFESDPDRGWIGEVADMVRHYPIHNAPPFTYLFVTNFTWHYDGRNLAGPGRWIWFNATGSPFQLKDPRSFSALKEGLDCYGVIPPDE